MHPQHTPHMVPSTCQACFVRPSHPYPTAPSARSRRPVPSHTMHLSPTRPPLNPQRRAVPVAHHDYDARCMSRPHLNYRSVLHLDLPTRVPFVLSAVPKMQGGPSLSHAHPSIFGNTARYNPRFTKAGKGRSGTLLAVPIRQRLLRARRFPFLPFLPRPFPPPPPRRCSSCFAAKTPFASLLAHQSGIQA
ncbi:hypothetical protein B0H13DRAFT_557441 [Mycena leptocephala]|nr:hypothetical protein B0H13DRAFT_557441 [Mycena leptocephala]